MDILEKMPVRQLRMPERRTGRKDVQANLLLIEKVKQSACDELAELRAKGRLSSEIYIARRNVIAKAFESYAFPWMTEEFVPYWKAANSENGAKDFKPGTVYYGLPYTQRTPQRSYDAEKALEMGRFMPYGDTYLLDTGKLVNGTYCGCDCSSYVAGAYWGTSYSSGWDTRRMYSAPEFITLDEDAELYPGDILIRKGHVIFFLYYVPGLRSHMVMLEQGGPEKGINTVSASIRPLSKYIQEGFIPRRYAKF